MIGQGFKQLIIQKPVFDVDQLEEGSGCLFQKKGDHQPRFGIIKDCQPLIMTIVAWSLNADDEDRGRGARKITPVTLLATELQEGNAKFRLLDPSEFSFEIEAVETIAA